VYVASELLIGSDVVLDAAALPRGSLKESFYLSWSQLCLGRGSVAKFPPRSC